jgi:hypothetical protein
VDGLCSPKIIVFRTETAKKYRKFSLFDSYLQMACAVAPSASPHQHQSYVTMAAQFKGLNSLNSLAGGSDERVRFHGESPIGHQHNTRKKIVHIQKSTRKRRETRLSKSSVDRKDVEAVTEIMWAILVLRVGLGVSGRSVGKNSHQKIHFSRCEILRNLV